MIITERERLALVKSLEIVLGQHDAATLMEYLPANGWREVATKTDLDNLRLSMKADMADMRTELKTEFKTGLADLRTEFERQLRKQIMWLVTTMISLVAILAAIDIFKP